MFSRPSLTLISFAFLIIAIAIVGSNSNRVLRRKNRQTHYYYAPVGAETYSSPDRSVYARRNFGRPDVVSDVYEVYVRPSNTQQSQPKTAVVILSKGGKGGHDGVYGVLTFTQASADAPVRINGTIYNLPSGQHGMHVHTAGDLRDGCTSCGPHYNPYKLNHGDIRDRERHIGDLGNIDSNGSALVDVHDKLISLTGVNSILGRSMVVHEKRDDGGRGGNDESKKTGNSGARVACGVIGLVQ